jgi:hypothetical protein
MRIFYFPEMLYDPVTKTGKFLKPVYLVFCGSKPVDSLNFNRFKHPVNVKYDNVSRAYYVISTECNIPGICCDNQPAICFLALPLETESHCTTLIMERDTAFFQSDSMIKDLRCIGGPESALYSFARFEGSYFYIKNYLRNVQNYNSKPDRYKNGIFQLYKEDYTAFEYSDSTIIVKMKTNGLPGFYLKEYQGFIPIKHYKKRKFRSTLLSYPYEIGIKRGEETITEENLKIKKRRWGKKIIIKVKSVRRK